eukprot:COSAG01_NODE_4686_length_4811_cov_4.669355_3_plen_178_part_00
MHTCRNIAARSARTLAAGFWLFPKGWVSELLICRFANAGVVGGRLWPPGFPLCFCEKYGNLARTDLKNEQISQSRRFQACSEIIRGAVVGWSETETHPLGKSQNPGCHTEPAALPAAWLGDGVGECTAANICSCSGAAVSLPALPRWWVSGRRAGCCAEWQQQRRRQPPQCAAHHSR